MRWLQLIPALAVLAAMACGPESTQTATSREGQVTYAQDVAARRAQFAREELAVELSALPASEQTALVHLVQAARIMDSIFLRQAWRENATFGERVATLAGTDSEAAKEYYRIMFGPWDRLVDFEPFIGNVRRPAGAGYYPEDMTAEEFHAWIEANPGDRDAFMSTVTVIRRSRESLTAVPYSLEYGDLLQQAASELRMAAAATENGSLRRFLELRASAFETNDYYESDMAWMDLDSAIEVVIGPYETYEDTLFGYKAAFESFVCVAQPEDSKRLAVFKGELPYLEQSLPIPDEHKNPNRGSESPIRVADEVFTAGDAKAGVQTLAFNLPNDERVREAKGSKKVLLKNMMYAKYDAILTPIAERALPEGAASHLDFDAYFHFILFHEMAHGLGPGRITKNGRATEVRLELKDLYSALEEAKADVLGVFDLFQLADKGVVDEAIMSRLPWTYTAGLFRSARFGTTEAHGLGVVIQVNYLLGKGAIEVTEAGRFQPVPDRFRDAFRDLAHEILMLQAEGSYAKATELVEAYGRVPPAMEVILESLGDIPVDVDPAFVSVPVTD